MAARLPGHLLDTYEQYKLEEEAVIGWICQAAIDCGHKFDVQTSEVQEAELNGLRVQADMSQLSVELPIYEMIIPISTIVNSKEPKQVPIDIAEKIRSIIGSRARCAAWFRRNTRADDEAGQTRNRTHLYPIQVLRQMVLMLSGLWPKAVPMSLLDSSHEAIDSPYRALSNPFEMLDHEHSQWHEVITEPFSNDNIARTVLKARRTKDEQECYKQIQAEDQLRLAKMCLLEELASIEALVVQHWMSFLLGNQTLHGALVVTENAINLVAKQEMESGMTVTAGHLVPCWPEGFFAGLERFDDLAKNPFLRMNQIICAVLTTTDLAAIGRFASSTSATNAFRSVDYLGINPMQQLLCELAGATRILYTNIMWSSSSAIESGDIQLLHSLRRKYENGLITSPEQVSISEAFAVRMHVLVDQVASGAMKDQIKAISDHASIITNSVVSHNNMLSGKVKMFNNITDKEDCDALAEMHDRVRDMAEASSLETQQLLTNATPVCKINVAARRSCSMTLLHAIFSSRTLINSKILAPLAIVYQICKEEGGLPKDVMWEDVEHLSRVLGDAVVFTAGDGPAKADRHRYMARVSFALGFLDRDVKQQRKDDIDSIYSKSKLEQKALQPKVSNTLLGRFLRCCNARMFKICSLHSTNSIKSSLFSKQRACRRAKV